MCKHLLVFLLISKHSKTKINVKMKKIINMVLQKLNYRIVSAYGYTLIDKHEISKKNLVNLMPLVLNLLSNDMNEIRFVQVGANNGVTNDNFRDYLEKYNFTGIMIEPQERAYKKLNALYAEHPNIICENIAISITREPIEFYYFDKQYEKGMQLDVFSSTYEKHLTRWKRKMRLEANIVKEVISTTTVDDLLKKYDFRTIEILIIDTEGYDYEIIKSINFDSLHPYLIQYEHINLSAKDQLDAIGLLISKDYEVLSYEKDTIAVHKSIFNLI